MYTIALKCTTEGRHIKKRPRNDSCQKLMVEAAFTYNCKLKDVTVMQVAQQAALEQGGIPEWYS